MLLKHLILLEPSNKTFPTDEEGLQFLHPDSADPFNGRNVIVEEENSSEIWKVYAFNIF